MVTEPLLPSVGEGKPSALCLVPKGLIKILPNFGNLICNPVNELFLNVK